MACRGQSRVKSQAAAAITSSSSSSSSSDCSSSSSSSTRSWMLQPHLARDGFSAKTQLAQSSIYSKKQTYTSDTSEKTPAPRLESPRKTTAASVVVYDRTSAVESDLDGGRRRHQMAARGEER